MERWVHFLNSSYFNIIYFFCDNFICIQCEFKNIVNVKINWIYNSNNYNRLYLMLNFYLYSFCTVGLVVVLIDIPYDITSVKFVHWTWHDTDPNISDRHYWVPWNSYYFHCAFATSFTFWFHNIHYLMSRSKSNVKWTKSRWCDNNILPNTLLICAVLN